MMPSPHMLAELSAQVDEQPSLEAVACSCETSARTMLGAPSSPWGKAASADAGGGGVPPASSPVAVGPSEGRVDTAHAATTSAATQTAKHLVALANVTRRPLPAPCHGGAS